VTGKERGIISCASYEAKRICPDLIILPSDYETYSIYSKRLFAIIRDFTPSVEEFSIDEAFCDLTGLTGKELHTFLKNIPLEMVCGFGPNTIALLQKHAIRNVFDYIQRPAAFAQKLLGKIGIELWKELRGESVYRGCSLEAELNRHSSSTLDFTQICSVLFDRIFDKKISYRATGVVLSGIVAEGVDRRTLFDDPVKIQHIENLSKAVDKINEIHGKYAVHIASSDAAITKGGKAHREEANPRDCLPQRKKELLKGETFRKHPGIPLLKLS
jgi:impB/mucB/samB family